MTFPTVKVRRGLAGVLWQQMKAINAVPKFKESYADKSLKFLYNLTDQKYGALITVENGELNVEHIETTEENLEDLEVDASLTCPGGVFFDFSSGNLSTLKMIWYMIIRKIKIKGMKKMQELEKIMSLM